MKIEQNQQQWKRFTILNQCNQFRWVPPDNISICANSHFPPRLQNKKLKEGIQTLTYEKQKKNRKKILMSWDSTSDYEADFAIQDLLNLVQQTVLLVKKYQNTISHFIHLNQMMVS